MTDNFIRTWRADRHTRKSHSTTSQETLVARMESTTSSSVAALGGNAAASSLLSVMNVFANQPKLVSPATTSYPVASNSAAASGSTLAFSTEVDAFVGFAAAATDSPPSTSEGASSSLETKLLSRMGTILATSQLKSKRPATKKQKTNTKQATTRALTATATVTATLPALLPTDPYMAPYPTIESLASNSSGSNHLSRGAVVGIAAASTIAALMLAAGAILFFKRRTALAAHRQRALNLNSAALPKHTHSDTSSETTTSPEPRVANLDPVHKKDTAHSDFMYPTHESLARDSVYATMSRTKRVAFSDPIVQSPAQHRKAGYLSDEGSLPEYDSMRTVSPLIPISEVCVHVDPVSYTAGRRASIVGSDSAYEDPYDYSRPDTQLPVIQTLDRYYESSLYSEPRHT
ncbi:hypothetical protein BJ741DRAFT_630629 [Chytriomyces cf. hyalinus JEL632]|nr:hypothetical protein BJ741DRAFT_630629 [Chytriomyces cf. hyalinus JEL632]